MLGFGKHRRQLIMLCGALMAVMTSITPLQASQEEPPGEEACANAVADGCFYQENNCFSCTAFCASKGTNCVVKSGGCNYVQTACESNPPHFYHWKSDCTCKVGTE